MKQTKNTMKLGVASMAGQFAIGSISSKVPGSSKSAGTINTALYLTNVGQLVKVSKKII